MKEAVPRASPPRPRLLGVTGNIACGKSTVAARLHAKGAPVLDSDALVHELYADTGFAAKIARLFTADVRDSAGRVDRQALGKVVFADAGALARLESLVHPAVAGLRAQRLQDMPSGTEIVVIEAVKLLESGQGVGCEEIWNVQCSLPVQLQRLMALRHLSEDEARARLNAQPSNRSKLDLAGEIPLVAIQNDGSLSDLEAKVDSVWNAFASRTTL